MMPLSPALRFFLYAHATDMRKSFDGLSGLVTSALTRDPTNGDVYVFLNRRRNRMKLLLWDRNGFWLFYKRLEQGTFQLPGNLAEQTEEGYCPSYSVKVKAEAEKRQHRSKKNEHGENGVNGDFF